MWFNKDTFFNKVNFSKVNTITLDNMYFNKTNNANTHDSDSNSSNNDSDYNDSNDLDDEGYNGYGGYNEYGKYDKDYYYCDRRYERKGSLLMSPIIFLIIT